MSVRTLLAGIAASAVTASALSLAAVAPASADPASTPDANDIVGVGSDTIEDVLDVLANGTGSLNGYNHGKTASDALLASFKTVGSAQVTLRSGSAPIDRPVGSGTGKGMLYGSTNNTDVTYARSSSAINSTEKAANLFAFPFAVDTLKMGVKPGGNAPANLTEDDILKIYTGVYTHWNEIPGNAGGSTAQIDPYVPQSGSGTRTFFELQLKRINGGTQPTYGGTVDQNQHENTDEVFHDAYKPGLLGANAIAPFSVAKGSTLYPTTVHIEGPAWDRAMYNVVRQSSLADSTIQGIFGSDGFICSTEARPLIEAAGFKQLATPDHLGVCGAATQDPTSNLTLNEQVVTTTHLTPTSPSAKTAKLVASVTGSTAPSGAVDFFEGATKVGSAVPLVSGQATTTLTGVTPGVHTYRAVFVPGDDIFEASEASASVNVQNVVVKTKPSVSESFPAKVKLKKKAKSVSVRGVVTVKGSTGKVTIKRGSKVVKSATLKSGRATVTLPKLKKGTYRFTITYAGDATHLATTKTFTVKVVK